MAFFDSVKGGFAKIGQKSGEMLETQKLKMRKSSLENEIKDLFTELGTRYYNMIKSGEAERPEDDRIIRKISMKVKALNELDDKILASRGMVVCPSCGSEISEGDAFCANCGYKIRKPAPKDETAEPVKKKPAAAPAAEPVKPAAKEEAAEAVPDEPVKPAAQEAAKEAEELKKAAEKIGGEAEEELEEAAEDLGEEDKEGFLHKAKDKTVSVFGDVKDKTKGFIDKL